MKRIIFIKPEPNTVLKEELRNILVDSNSDPRIRLRVAMVLRSSQGSPDRSISEEFGTSREMVKTWVERYLDVEEFLNEYALEHRPDEVRGLIVRLLSDKNRTGAPKKFDDKIIQEIRELANSDPRKYGHQVKNWTYNLIAKTAISEGIVPEISMSSVCRIFKKPASRYFQENYWKCLVDD